MPDSYFSPQIFYMKRILIIDDEIHICTLLATILNKEGYQAEYCIAGVTALKLIKENRYDLVFCDYRLKDKEIDGNILAGKIKESSPDTDIVIMTGYPDVRIAIQMIKNGVSDYLQKPLNVDQLLLLTRKLFLPKQATSTSPFPPTGTITTSATVMTAKVPSGTFIFGESHSSKQLHEQIKLIAPTDYSVIIMGETGTGKESVAHLIHSQSKRKDKPFVAIDCGSLSRELASSELFGHEKGSFTGAITAKTGAFVEANGGTLFLDEIGNLSYDVQTTLLRAIQERLVRSVGSNSEVLVDIRIIVATNEDLQQSVLNGRFREDLYYRLNEFTVNVPPLRQRMEDLPFFVDAFKTMAEKEIGKSYAHFNDDVWQIFYQYRWPGNVRELKNVIRRLCLLSTGSKEITVNFLPEEMQVKQMIKEDTSQIFVPDYADLKRISKQAEYDKILTVLKQVRFNKSKAARLMNIDRKTLYNKLHSLNILV
jgi:two-component system response regulator HydG